MILIIDKLVKLPHPKPAIRYLNKKKSLILMFKQRLIIQISARKCDHKWRSRNEN